MPTANTQTDSGIRVITEPAVYLVGKQTVGEAELDRFLADHAVSWESDSEVAAEVLTETAGRTCYLSFAKPRPGGNATYLHHIKEVGHGSVLEHALWNFIITGGSRSLTHELVRHRAGVGFPQLSQRYVRGPVAVVECVGPDAGAPGPELHALGREAVAHGDGGYLKVAEKLNAKRAHQEAAAAAMLPPNADRTTRRKAAREAALCVLPTATE